MSDIIGENQDFAGTTELSYKDKQKTADKLSTLNFGDINVKCPPENKISENVEINPFDVQIFDSIDLSNLIVKVNDFIINEHVLSLTLKINDYITFAYGIFLLNVFNDTEDITNSLSNRVEITT